MRVSVTERQTYKRCRRKWDYTSYNRQSLSPVVNAPALDLGTIVHAVLAEWTADPTLDPVQVYQTTSQQYFQNLVSVYTSRVGCAPSIAELQPTMDAIALGLSMIQNYRTQWGSPLPPGFTLIANEQSLVQPVPGTEHCTGICECCLGTVGSCLDKADCCLDCIALHELECTFDGVMADERGDLYIIERKTFSRTPSLEELDNNDQFLAYQWAAEQAGFGKIVGIAYDGLLKKAKPSGVHNTLDKLFLRRTLLRGQIELAEFGSFLAQEVLEMANPNVPIYKTVPPVQGCQRWECSFLELCHATSKGYPTNDLLKMYTRVDRKSHLDLVAEEP